VKELRQQGFSICAIARRTKLHWVTIRNIYDWIACQNQRRVAGAAAKRIAFALICNNDGKAAVEM
jgi:hypothetical protein